MPIVLGSPTTTDSLSKMGPGTILQEPSATPTTMTREQFDAMSMRVYKKTADADTGLSPWEGVARYAAGTAIDTADSVWSTPLNPWGDRGDVWSYASPEMQDYYEKHKDLIQTSSAIAGGVLTVVAAEALVVPRIVNAFASSTALTGSRLWKMTAGWNISSRTAMMEGQMAAASSGEAFGLLSTAAGRNFMLNRTAAGIANVTRTAPAEYALMWNNEVFNSKEWDREGFVIGVGIALGGTIGAVAGRAAVRRVAGSETIRLERAKPFASAGMTNDVLSHDYLDMVSRIDPEAVQLKQSALFTEYSLGARAATPVNTATVAASKLNKFRGELDSAKIDTLQKIIVKGLPGVPVEKAAVAKLPELANIATNLSKTDPFLLHGIDSMGVVKTSIEDAQKLRKSHIEMLQKQSDIEATRGNVKEAKRLNRQEQVLQKQEEAVLVNGSWMDPGNSLAKAVARHDAGRAAELVKTTTKFGETVSIQLPKRGKITIDASLAPRAKDGTHLPVEHMDFDDRLMLDAASAKLVQKLKAKNATTRFKLTDESAKSWYSLDMAAHVIEQGGKIEYGVKNLKLANVGDIQRESLRLKANAVLAEAGPAGRITDEVRFRYNLPAATAMENLEDAAGDGFRNWVHAAAKNDGTQIELAQALMDARVIQGVELRPKGNVIARTDGDMLRFNRDEKGNWMRPVLGYFDLQSKIAKISEGAHSTAMTLYKAEKTAKLLAGNTHVNALAAELAGMTELRIAMNLQGMHDDQITGLGGGLGQLIGEILPKRFLARDSQAILAAGKLQEAAARHGLANYKNMVDTVGMQKIVTTVTGTGHAATRTQLDQYFSLAGGWDIDGFLPLKDGLSGLVLRDTASNRKRLGLDELEDWDPYTFLSNDRINQPVALNDTAVAAIQSYEKLTKATRDADNVIRAAKGMAPVNFRSFFVPSPDTRNKFVAFVMDENNKVVPGRTIVASSAQEYDSLVKQTLRDLGRNSGYTIRDREQLSSLRDIYDEVDMDWINPGISSATAGLGQQRGGLTGSYVKQGAFIDALDWVKNKSVAQSQDTLKTLMSENLQFARVMSATESATAGSKEQRNIYDVYEKTLTGQSQAYDNTSIGDKAFRKIEESINRVLANSSIAVPARHFVDLAQRIGMDPTDLSGKRTYKAIADAMGEYTPFANAVEFMESRGVKRPPTVKGMATKMNSMAASVLLRWFEVPHAMMNGLGVIATMPAAVLSGVSPISTFVELRGQKVGFVDGAKIMAQGMADMFTKRGSADFAHMVKTGDATQSALEYYTQLGAIQSQAGYMKWLSKSDKWISYLSDTSESMSRQVSHFVGLRLADYHRIEGMAARHDFAREIANSMIADYAPVNRPELFGSGFGSMFGLFQSYALNHYSKMFRWMEDGQYRAMGLQAGMQAVMFGVPGTYGLRTLMDLRDSATSTGSEPTALDEIYKRFGPVLGGAIAHGSVSQLTGLGLWTRGDTNFRIPGASGTLAPLEIGTKVARGFVDGVSAYLNAMPGEGAHAMLEVVQREMPNRVMRSWLTLANGGKEIDAYGQVMSDTQTWMDTVARVVGVRSNKQQSELEAFYAGKAGIQRDAARMERLRESFRSAVRNNSGDASKVSPQQYFNDYVKAGGNPRMFKTWARNLLRDADSPRAIKALNNSAVTAKSALETWRFGAYGAWNVE